LVAISVSDARYSQAVIVPCLTAALLYLDRHRIFRSVRPALKPAVPLLAIAGTLIGLGLGVVPPSVQLCTSILGLAIAFVGLFILCYGTAAFDAARFPLAFLFLGVPLPSAFMERVSQALQVTSADMAHVLFRAVGVPVFREGFMFTLPGQIIEVAEECSGIRSAIAFLITAILVGYLFLRSMWRRIAFVAVAVAVSIVKNAVRIVVLSTAGKYVGVDLLNSSLHHEYGGAVFSALALAIIAPVLYLLRRGETAAVSSGAGAQAVVRSGV
jgi:exosortase